jgi:hypothetical protein
MLGCYPESANRADGLKPSIELHRDSGNDARGKYDPIPFLDNERSRDSPSRAMPPTVGELCALHHWMKEHSCGRKMAAIIATPLIVPSGRADNIPYAAKIPVIDNQYLT